MSSIGSASSFVFVLLMGGLGANAQAQEVETRVRVVGHTQAGVMVRVRDVAHDRTCEVRSDEARRCVELRAPRRGGARGMITGGTFVFAASALIFAAVVVVDGDCHADCGGNGLEYAISTVYGAGGVFLISFGGARLHRSHAVERELGLRDFAIAPMIDPSGGGAPTGLVLRAAF